jgi:small GTP-binding protein
MPKHTKQQNIPSGLKLRHTLQGHTGTIRRIMWSPDGQALASASADHTIRLWDGETGTLLATLEGHTEEVNSVVWSSDKSTLISGSDDQTIRIWDTANGIERRSLKWQASIVRCLAWSEECQTLAAGTENGKIWLLNLQGESHTQMDGSHSRPVYDLAWSPDGRLLASASMGGTARLWNTATRNLLKMLDGFMSVAWSPDGQMLASTYYDNTILLWNPHTGQKIGILEGHTNTICSLTFSSDGSLLASKSYDHTIRLWRCDSWELLVALTETSNVVWPSNIAFHPSAPILATLGEMDWVIRIWDLDRAALFQHHTVDNVHYTNAKVVLVGDSGVGKSGLGLVLSGQPFAPTESTHGRRVWVFDTQTVSGADRGTETRETILWDLAGQPGYRIVHQLHLNEVAVALVVFDARSETDPFAGVRHWDRALRQAQRVQGDQAGTVKKILVAARTDRGGVGVSKERIESLIHDLGFEGYFETSAKEGLNIIALKTALQNAINWETLPRVISTELFQRIKDFIVAEKAAARLLSTADDLYYAFLKTPDSPAASNELRAQFETCIGRVESRGLIRRLSFGNLILLQPELLDAYASGLVNAAKEEPDGLGCIVEEDARVGRFHMSSDERIKDKEQEQLLLLATIENMLRHEIALREPADDGSYLIFPSQLTREHPDLPDPEGVAIIFTFMGSVLNIYATLAVRLSHSGVCTKQDMWKNAATFTALVGGLCGLYLRELDEGYAELTLFFDPDASEQTRFQFEQFVHTHLRRRALPESIQRRRIFVCGKCRTPVSDLQAQRRRERGFDSIVCNVCEAQVSLLDREERLLSTRSISVTEMEQAADTHRELETAESILQGKLVTGDGDIHAWELIVTKRRRLHELEKQRAFFGVATAPQIIMEIEDLDREIASLEARLKRIIGRSY